MGILDWFRGRKTVTPDVDTFAGGGSPVVRVTYGDGSTKEFNAAQWEVHKGRVSAMTNTRIKYLWYTSAS